MMPDSHCMHGSKRMAAGPVAVCACPVQGHVCRGVSRGRDQGWRACVTPGPTIARTADASAPALFLGPFDDSRCGGPASKAKGT
jgi:hypothetical protein